VLASRPVRVLVVTEPGHPTLALITTDPTTPIIGIVERYAAHWSIEVAFEDAKQITASVKPATAPRSSAPSRSGSTPRQS
jgi:hypothetical protein